MLKKILRAILPNPLDSILISAHKKNFKSFLLGWNRGIGDIPLGLFAVVHRIRWFVPDAKITFMIRSSLQEGFSLFPQVKTIVAPSWKRGDDYSIASTLSEMNIPKENFDVIIEKPDPTYWVKYQIGRVRPYLTWDSENDGLSKKFDLPEGYVYVAAQPHNDTNHSPWREYPEKKWADLFDFFDRTGRIKVILFGLEKKGNFQNRCLIDLRGKTALLDVLSIIKNRCSHAILPDGGILSLLYYLNVNFPLRLVTLWSDKQGVLKQNVESPNKQLMHLPIVRSKSDFKDIDPEEIYGLLLKDISRDALRGALRDSVP